MSDHDELGDELRRRADQLGDTTPLSLNDIRGRARGIRRRRIAVSALAAAAIVAVAVPAGVAVTGDVGTGPDRAPVAGPSGAPTTSPTSVTPVRVALTTDAPPSAYAAGIPYLQGRTIVQDPSTADVHLSGDYTSFVPLGDGWVGTRTDQDNNAFLDLLDADGKVTGTVPSADTSLAVSADGTVVAYATPDGRLMTLVTNAAPMAIASADALPGAPLQPVAVVGTGSCVENAASGGCAVMFNGQEPNGQSGYSVTSHGIVARLPHLLSVTGMSPDGSLSGVTSVTDEGACSVVLGRSWDKAWSTCNFTLGQFSPNGRYVIGHPSYRDGIGDGSVAVLDARTGDVLAEYSNSEEHQSFINNVVWDTDSTLLATVFEGGSWSLMRMTAGGELTTVAGDLGSNMDHVPVRLPARP